jgi:ATP-dependent RNA helicase DeaD
MMVAFKHPAAEEPVTSGLGPDTPMRDMDKLTFDRLGLSPELLQAVAALGFEEAAPIQAVAIPFLLEGRDVVGQSQTGSGKTAAFAIPAIELCDPTVKAVQVLVLCPTRELATQVADQVHKLAAFKRGIHALPVYGGASFERQAYELKRGSQIVIGTPGRVIDHLERGTMKLDRVKFVALDEADRMLDMGFRDDIRKILDSVPEQRQTAFFSATVSPAIRSLINRYAREPVALQIEQKEVSAPAIEQWFYEVQPRMKFDALMRLIDYHAFRSGVIFCNTQRMVDELADDLMAQGVPSDRLHGGIAQAQRTRVMNKFKKAGFEFLVATDVAARGIDVHDLELVVNFDLPYDPEDYVHRIGRTGRAGKRGMAVTFVSGRDLRKIQFLERFARTKIRRGTLPTAGEIGEKRVDALLARVRSVLDEGAWKAQASLVDRLLEEGVDSTELAAALFQILSGPVPEDPKSEPPAKVSSPSPSRGPEFKSLPPKTRGGRAWITLSLGREGFSGPKDVVDLLVKYAGLSTREVGRIDLGEGSSLVEVPAAFALGLSPDGNWLETAGGRVQVSPMAKAGQPRKQRQGRR